MRHAKRFVGNKSRELFSGKQVPDDGGLPNVVGHDQATRPCLADIVGRNQNDILGVLLKASFNGQGMMLKTDDGGTLRIQYQGGGASQRFKG